MFRFFKLSALMAILLFNAVLLLSVISLRAVPAASRGAGGGLVGTKNGDVNCDGRINIADPVYLLQYLFNHGSDTCVLAQESDVLTQLKTISDQITALQSSIATLGSCWPPKTEDIVSLIQTGNDGAAGVEVYKVPAGKVFVLVSFIVQAGVDGQYGQSEIWEVSNGKPTLRGLRMHEPFTSPIGIRFTSGSTVLAKLRDPNQSPSGNIPYSFTGYLTQE